MAPVTTLRQEYRVKRNQITHRMVRDRTQGGSPHPLWVSGLLRNTDERLIVQAQHCPLAYGVLQVLGKQVCEVSAGLGTVAVNP